MTHQEAVEQMLVERYLLGELSGAPRDHFEEHLFDCGICAVDLKGGVAFLEAATPELKAQLRSKPRQASVVRSNPLAWLWQPSFLAPALAACLAVIVYQSAVLLPHAHAELAEAQTPAVLAPLTLANGGTRGGVDTLPSVPVPHHGFYLLSVDIPPAPTASGFRCSLHDATGTELWHLDLTPGQARDAVTLQVPVAKAQPGTYELRVQSIAGDGGTLVNLTSYKYALTFNK